MSCTVVVLDRARDDIEAARDFYDECEVGVGEYFVDCILSDISSLQIIFRIAQSPFWFSTSSFEAGSICRIVRTRR